MEPEIRLVIADDHPLMRQGIRQSLDAAPGLKVVAEAGDGKTALELLCTHRPQVAVLDISMPLMDGFGVLREVRNRRLPVEIVFLTAQSDESLFDEAIAQGVKGYVLKESAATDIVTGVRAVAAGRYYASPALTNYLMRGRQQSKIAGQSTGVAELTATELRVMRLVAEYKTTREIAETMHVSPLTVETHRRNICEKLGLRGSNALIKFAAQHKDEIR